MQERTVKLSSERRCMTRHDFVHLPWHALRVEFSPRGNTRARRSNRWRALRRAFHTMNSDRIFTLGVKIVDRMMTEQEAKAFDRVR